MKCEEKRRYETKAFAKDAARKIHHHGRPIGRPYHCPECGYWHLTTADAASRTRIRAREREAAAKGKP